MGIIRRGFRKIGKGIGKGFRKATGTDLKVRQEAFELPGFEDLQRQFREQARLQVDLGQVDPSQFVGDQQQLVGQLQADAAGQGPAQALLQRQLQLQTQRGLGQLAGQAASANQANAALAARSAALAGGQLQGEAARALGEGTLAAQLAARQQLAGALGQFRGQDQALEQLRQQRLIEQARINQRQREFGVSGQLETSIAQQGGLTAAENARLSRPRVGPAIIGATLGAGETLQRLRNSSGGGGGAP